MKLIKNGDKYIALSSYEERAIPKEAGFRWNPTARHWWTDDRAKALKLADPVLAAQIVADAKAVAQAKAESAVASRATDATADIPVPSGLAYLGYQKAGIAYAASRPGVLIADEMGLGKTIQAIGIANGDASVKSVLVICPASLKINWSREWTKWSVRPMSVGIANGSLPATDVVIINYDVISKHRAAIDTRQWDLLIVDESHYLKNAKAQRTKAVLGGGKGEAKIAAIAAKRRVFLTGTPILNRPNELWTIVQSIDPRGLGANFFKFHQRYCDARQNRFGWDFSGASNLDELQRRLRETCMVRRLKSEVLTELPAKRRQVIEVEVAGSAAIVRAEQAAWDARQDRLERAQLAVLQAEAAGDDEAYKAAVRALQSENMVAFTEMSKVRHDTAVAKIPAIVEHLEAAIEASGKIIFFAHHLDVIQAVADHFGSQAVTLTGSTSLVDRQAAVDRFQTDPSITLFCGNVLAAGVGITLTASSHVVFGELDWRPGMCSQAEDRAHRIGQHNSVLVQHLVIDGSLDARMARTIIEKQEVIDRALDKGQAAAEAELKMPTSFRTTDAAPTAPAPALVPTRTASPRADHYLTPAQIDVVHAALRSVAAMDTDRAAMLNGVGFSRIDNAFGHSLANAATLSQKQAWAGLRLCQKYRRQIGTDLMRDFGY